MRRSGALYAVGLAIGLGAGLLAAWLCNPTAKTGLLGQSLYRAELSLYDYRLAWAPSPGPSPDIVIVMMDEESFSQPELSIWPWPRGYHARVMRNLAEAGARLIGVDIILAGTSSSDAEPPPGADPFFWEPPLSEDDEELAAALRDAGNVVLAMEVATEAVGEDEAAGELTVANFPHVEFETAALALGAVNLPTDLDGTARRYLTSVIHQDVPYPSMAVRLAALYGGEDPAALEARVLAAARSDHPALPATDFLVHYRGPVSRGFTRIPYHRALSGDFDPADVAGKIVLIGAGARSLQDLYDTPVSLRGIPGTGQAVAQMPGVEIIASATDTILGDGYIVPAPASLFTVLTALLSVLMGAVVVSVRPLKGLALGWLPLVALSVVLTFEIMWQYALWLPLMPLLLGVTLTYVFDTVYLELTAQREERRLRRMWSMRVSPEVLRVILNNPELAKVAGRHVVGTVFFSDLREFTTFCHASEPEEVVRQVNKYLTIATEVILDHGGTVHKFIGDGVMAVFGDPVHQDDHAARALAASLDIQERMAELRARAAEGEWQMIVRIGLHSGELVAGDIGSENMLEYTVMGETVSIASRLEGLNKDLGTSILMSADTAHMLDGGFTLQGLGEIEVRGRPEPLEVFTVEDAPPGAPAADAESALPPADDDDSGRDGGAP